MFLVVILSALLGLSVLLNIFQYYRWNRYRSRPAGVHSHTGMMPKISQDTIEQDRKRGNG
jgi:hypothetical protein